MQSPQPYAERLTTGRIWASIATLGGSPKEMGRYPSSQKFQVPNPNYTYMNEWGDFRILT